MKPTRSTVVVSLVLAFATQSQAAELAKAPLTPAEFVQQAALSDVFEAKSSELAAIKADTPTFSFAAQINADPQKISSQLRVIVKGRQNDLPLPPRLDARRQAQVDRLSELDGEAFTRQYQLDQLKAHRAAVSLFQSFSISGSDDRLRQWATQTLPMLEEHLKHAETLSPKN